MHPDVDRINYTELITNDATQILSLLMALSTEAIIAYPRDHSQFSTDRPYDVETISQSGENSPGYLYYR